MTTKKPPASKKAGGEAVPEKQSSEKRFPPQAIVGDGTPGPGRKKGVPNKVTTQLKEMILNALEKAGGEEYLQTQARDNPGPFMTLLGKILPTQLTGKDGGPIETEDKTPLAPEERAKRIHELALKAGYKLQDAGE
jgi:hypothetical protein